MKKRAWPYWILLAAVLASAAVIFFFSSQSDDASNRTSGYIIKAVISIFYPNYDTLSSQEQYSIYQDINYFVRKGAHFSEFALLGFSLRALLSFHGLKWRTFISWFIGTLYAFSDELHQYLVGSRTAMVKDVLIDSAGALFGCLLAWLILRWLRKMYRKKYLQ